MPGGRLYVSDDCIGGACASVSVSCRVWLSSWRNCLPVHAPAHGSSWSMRGCRASVAGWHGTLEGSRSCSLAEVSGCHWAYVCRNEIGYRVEDFHAIRLQERGLAANTAPKNGEKGKGGKGRKGSKAGVAAAATAAPAASGVTAALNGSRGDRQSGAAAPATPANGTTSRSDADAGKSDAADDDSMTEDDRSAGGPAGAAVDGGEDGEEGVPEDDVEDDAAAADGMKAWWDYMYFSRVGLRRFLGMDAMDRKYWLMAGRAGAYQVRPLRVTRCPLPMCCGVCCNGCHAMRTPEKLTPLLGR